MLQKKKKRNRVIKWIHDKTHHCREATHFRSKDSQTESEGMGKSIPCKSKLKKSQGSNTYI